MSATLSEWERLVADKRQRQLESIPKEWIIQLPPREQLNVMDVPLRCGLLTAQELAITNVTSVAVLLQRLASSEWSSVEVIRAFCKRAVVAHQLTNCLTEVFIDTALQRAKELDDHLKRTGTVVGPLHGLPISLKDQFRIKGLETTMGYASWIGIPAEDNAVMVDLLLNCGAVLYVRTNIPQTLMWGETNNNVFGRTVNPFNRSLTPGGSSGGEAALIALRGSILGIGTDVGGSIRQPSHFCGLYGFKPSCHRLPSYRIVNSLDGQDSVSTCVGPISSSMSGIKILMKAVLDTKPWRADPHVLHIPWNETAYKLTEYGNGNKLCFGIMWDDETMTPHPPITRALKVTKAALEAAGHSVIDWRPFKHPEIRVNARSIWLADGGEDYSVSTAVSGEPIIHSMKPGADLNEVPSFRKVRPPLSAYQLWQLHREKRQLRKEHLDYWEATVSHTGTGRPIDAIICPVAPYSAVPHGESRSAYYTFVWNALDYPALVLPVTNVIPELDPKRSPHTFRDEDEKSLYDLYDPTVFAGAPVGVQLIGRTQEEESLIAMGEIVDNALTACRPELEPVRGS